MSEHEYLAELAQAELNPVQGSRRYQYLGFWDGHHCKAGEPTSMHPELIERYHERQRQLGLPGVWRNGQYPNKGTQRDVPFYIIEW